MVACKSCGKYSAGDLNSRITIQRKTTTPDGMGGVTKSWATDATVWAKWDASGRGETWRAQRINPNVSVKAVIRFRGDAYGAPYYTVADRVMYRNREWAIVSVVDPDDRQEWLELMLAEGVPS